MFLNHQIGQAKEKLKKNILLYCEKIEKYLNRHEIQKSNNDCDNSKDVDAIEEYINQHDIRKLHIGCGCNILNGWLNADLFSSPSGVVYINAADSFPVKDNTFDYIFSEHMIEHISYSKGLKMLSECYRTLRKNGKIRISTPNLMFLIDFYKENKSKLQEDYIKWSIKSFIKDAPDYAGVKLSNYNDTFVLNSFVRDWGHSFIYDEKTLRLSLERVGFTNITRCELKESESEALRNLEDESKMAKGFLRLVTFSLEGTKL